MTRVQFREDEDLIEYVTARGEDPNEVAKRAFEQEFRRMKAREARKALKGLAVGRVDGAAEVRQIRDHA